MLYKDQNHALTVSFEHSTCVTGHAQLQMNINNFRFRSRLFLEFEQFPGNLICSGDLEYAITMPKNGIFLFRYFGQRTWVSHFLRR